MGKGSAADNQIEVGGFGDGGWCGGVFQGESEVGASGHAGAEVHAVLAGGDLSLLRGVEDGADRFRKGGSEGISGVAGEVADQP
jgi:hypothetical protein